MISPAVLAVADAVVVDVDAVVDQFCAGPPTKILERLGRVFFFSFGSGERACAPKSFYRTKSNQQTSTFQQKLLNWTENT